MTTVTQASVAGRPAVAAETDVLELGARVARELARQKHLNTLPAPEPLRIIRVAADLQVGDWLDLGDREVLVTALIQDGDKVEIQSGTWWDTLPADESVTASPRQAVTS